MMPQTVVKAGSLILGHLQGLVLLFIFKICLIFVYVYMSIYMNACGAWREHQMLWYWICRVLWVVCGCWMFGAGLLSSAEVTHALNADPSLQHPASSSCWELSLHSTDRRLLAMASSGRNVAKIVLTLDNLVSTRAVGRHKTFISPKFVKLLESIE